uniref:Arabinogalactan peptide 20 n=1 Tax=Nicotiana tabacum TaxID=4097 RepID=A0A1S3YYU3_TOBAC|nr:arabinogalactan protein 20-like [Nicotiana tomentosiformis]XP_016457511.1 PREDICTED: arabinogalactan peptide 20-like [Nicotiana tabacum]
MAMSRVAVLAIFVVALATVIPFAQAQEFAPAPAPANDGTTIDQGIAYVLMLVALVLTYLIHPMDASAYSFF